MKLVGASKRSDQAETIYFTRCTTDINFGKMHEDFKRLNIRLSPNLIVYLAVEALTPACNGKERYVGIAFYAQNKEGKVVLLFYSEDETVRACMKDIADSEKDKITERLNALNRKVAT